VVDALIERAAVAVVRLPSVAQALDAIAALHAGGITAIEVTLTTPGALELIGLLRRNDALLVGAGSVLTSEQATQAIEAGARYVVSPVYNAAVLDVAHAHNVAALPGAYTPTEIMHAHTAGADLVKVFPADTLGPAFIKGVLAPMPFLELMPTGGVTPDNVATWLAAGAVAVGLGSALVDTKTVANRDWSTLTSRAQTVMVQVAQARARIGVRP
jgi:2-dehydro-3-deoxyphosphogluconate aldolase/(4S)-4-hydroxy-2-oxoglutarate aldolase